MFQFQNFLNSLDFSIQIFIQSRKLDIRPYIALLEGREKEQSTDLMKIQTREYIEFIKTFTESTNIMTKTFFIVVPYAAAVIEGSSNVKNIFGKKKNPPARPTRKQTGFVRRTPKPARAEDGCHRARTLPLRTAHHMLGTEEVVELFYKIFNPGDTEKPIALAS